jgi:hypothetical protein
MHARLGLGRPASRALRRVLSLAPTARPPAAGSALAQGKQFASIAEAAKANDLTAFLDFLTKEDLVDAVDKAGAVTIFAPSERPPAAPRCAQPPRPHACSPSPAAAGSPSAAPFAACGPQGSNRVRNAARA